MPQLACDAAPDGTVVWSDGKRVQLRDPGGAVETLATVDAVQLVAIC